MFRKKRKYRIIFSKVYQSVYWGVWKEVTGNHILSVLNRLKDKYDFEIVNFDIKDCFHKSRVTIRCEKKYRNDIFIEFCNILSGQIENVKIN